MQRPPRLPNSFTRAAVQTFAGYCIISFLQQGVALAVVVLPLMPCADTFGVDRDRVKHFNECLLYDLVTLFSEHLRAISFYNSPSKGTGLNKSFVKDISSFLAR